VAVLQVSVRDLGRVPEEELHARAQAAREALGSRAVILGHHYQQEKVVRYADFLGDSLKLSQQAALQPDAEFIVFCGVHFMAEVADILRRGRQKVVLPDLTAGCSMADMASYEQVLDAWDELGTVIPNDEITPVTYINSAADLKAFCGENGGTVCTSSNAARVLEWAFSRRPRVLFFPDQHLGRNTATAMGIPDDQMVVWDPEQPLGGNTPEAVRRARVILWSGYCSVHQLFRPEHVDLARDRDPNVRVVVHPECCREVVQKADAYGSTEYIVRAIREARPATHFAIGTELNLVSRLAKEHPEHRIDFLAPMQCFCSTMYRIDLPHFTWTLESLAAGEVVNQITVPEADKHWARVALERMLSV
jgi:quinolinate synthase